MASLTDDAKAIGALVESLDAFAHVALDVEALLGVIAERAATLLGDASLVTLVSEDGAWLQASAAHFPDTNLGREYLDMLGENPARRGEGRAGQVIEQNAPLLVPQVDPESLVASSREEWRGVVRRLAVHSLLIVPMRVRGLPVGAFTLLRNRPGRPYGAAEQALLQGLADRAALAVANARQHALLEQRLARAEHDADERALLRKLFDAMPQLGFTAQPDGFIDYYNRGWYEYTGTTYQQMEGWGWQAVHDPELLPRVVERWKVSLDEGSPFDMIFKLRRHDGAFRWFLTRITPMRNAAGEVVRWVGINTDIDDQKRLEEQLQAAREESELQSEERLRALSAQNEALVAKARVQEFQERFVAILGHDLRNPLAAIDMSAGLLLQRATKAADEPTTRLATRIGSSSRRMTRMIDQILDLTRSRLAGGLTVKPAHMDLAATLTLVVEELRSAHPGRAIELQAPKIEGHWDADRLEQVFSNLIGNAVAYGDDGHIDVLAAREAGQVEVRVHNGGAPIPAEVLGKLFTPFRRGSRESRVAQTAGLGLGLYISHELVAAHGGRIEVTSSASAGTTFCVHLPGSAPAAPRHGSNDVRTLP